MSEFITTITEAADILEVGEATISRFLNKGIMPKPVKTRQRKRSKSRIWRKSDLLELKFFIDMDKFELIKFIQQILPKRLDS